MPTVSKFEELTIWQMAREQARAIFRLTLHDSFAGDFALKNQINRSAGSVMDNIAEGFDRYTNKEFCQFLVIAKGSNAEVRSQLYRAYDRNYISGEVLSQRLDFSVQIGKKIKSFIDYLYSSDFKTKPKKHENQRSELQHPTSNIQPKN